MIYHSTQSDNFLRYLTLSGKQTKKTKTDLNTKFLPIFNGRNKNMNVRLQICFSCCSYFRTIRNDLLAIINLIAKTDPLAPFIEVGLARTILSLFSYSETRSTYEITRNLRFSECEEDFEFKRMLLAVIMNLTENPSFTPLMKEFKLLPPMFYYVSPVPDKDITWLPSQFEEIQLQCLASITKLLPTMLEELVQTGGLGALCGFLDWCLEPSDQDYKGHGNSVFGTGGRGSKLAQAKYTLKIMRKIISLGDEPIIEGLMGTGLLATYLAELNKAVDIMDSTVVHDFTPQAQSIAPDAFINLDITCEIMYTLALLMESSNDRKENIGEADYSLSQMHNNSNSMTKIHS